METSQAAVNNIDEYIALYPEEVQKRLSALRAAVRAAAPDVQERISYKMPSFVLHGTLIHFAAFKNHIGVYPVPRDDKEFAEELAGYAGDKATLKLPHNKPLPLELFSRIVKFRLAGNLRSAAEKAGGAK